MQILLAILGMTTFACVGGAIMILASSYSRRCWGVWLLTTAKAMEEKKAAILEINAEQKIRESDMRVSYGIEPIYPYRRDPENKLAKRATY